MTVGHGLFTLARPVRIVGPPDVADLAWETLGLSRSAGAEPAISLREVADPALGEEGYRLVVAPESIEATGTATGLRWAVQTLRQLVGSDSSIPVIEVTDRPRYAWRGSLLDVARWCHPIEFLHRFVDLLALHKLNTLHLHLTDDQGWRFEVRRYPRLTEVGAWRAESSAGHLREGRFDGTPHGGYYTQEQLRGLVACAARRGVRIMPEIDVPGHMQAAIAAYLWLGNDPAARPTVRTAWGISSTTLNVDDATVGFLADVLDELVDVFPFEMVHVGGDEVPPDEWLASAAARKRANALGLSGVEDLLGWWTGQLAYHLSGHNRRVGVWDEVLDHNPPEGATVFAWRDSTRVAAARNGGHPVVAAPQEYTYLDWAASTEPDEPLAIAASLPLERVYGFEPGDVLGVQGQLWSEYLPTPSDVEYRAFPRLAALAEVAWSSPEHRDLGDLRERLVPHLARLSAMGINPGKIR